MSNKLTSWAFWLSLISIVMSSAIIALWLLKAESISVIQLDTFIGVIVALMALLVTIVLGWQIYNAVEIKEKLVLIQSLQAEQTQLKSDIEQARKTIQKANIHNAFYHSTMMGLGAGMAGDYVSAYGFLLNALAMSLQADEPLEMKATISNLINAASAIKQGEIISKAHYNEYIKSDQLIRQSRWFTLCQDDYEEANNVFMSKNLILE